MSSPDFIDRLREYALKRFAESAPVERTEEAAQHLLQGIRNAISRLTDEQQEALKSINTDGEDPIPRAPPKTASAVSAMLHHLGLESALTWSERHTPPSAPHWEREEHLSKIVYSLPPSKSRRQALRDAAIRYSLGAASDTDETLLQTTLGPLLPGKGKLMTKYYFDNRNLPLNLQATPDQEAYIKAVKAELAKIPVLEPAKTASEQEIANYQATLAALVGRLLNKEQYDPNSFGFTRAAQEEWLNLLASVPQYPSGNVIVRDLYLGLAGLIATVSGLTASAELDVSYQEFASVGTYIADNSSDVPWGHPNILTQVRLGIDKYVSGGGDFGSLDLPPLTGQDGSDVEIVPDNIRAFALIYAGYQLERMRLFGVVDKLIEQFMNGTLPVGMDAGGKALDAYYWDAKNRMTEAERWMQYSRVLGVSGGEVSKDVAPNTDFDGLFMRFISSIQTYENKRNIDNLFSGNGRSTMLTGEAVRKAGRDLAANLSLHAWGYTHFAARRLNKDINTTMEILKQPQIQKAYGVDNPFQIIERASADTGESPNIVKYRTLAESGKAIIDLVAQYSRVWTSASTNPLFPDPALDLSVYQTAYGGNGGGNGSFAPFTITTDVSAADYLKFTRNVGYILAVMGIQDTQVDQYSQPTESTYSPSIPSFEGPNAGNNGNGNNSANLDQLRQMVAAGKTPSLDELQKMLPFKAGV